MRPRPRSSLPEAAPWAIYLARTSAVAPAGALQRSPSALPETKWHFVVKLRPGQPRHAWAVSLAAAVAWSWAALALMLVGLVLAEDRSLFLQAGHGPSSHLDAPYYTMCGETVLRYI